ncbi:MAG: PAS domain S-box protein, partial [Candidatus Aminicenantes bacterium]|nr:PAS domain S-box protein [Candidatus Aminicenantes bacterium]
MARNMKKSNTKNNQNNIHKDEMLERSFDAAPNLIMILDTKHKILRANKAMAKRLGTSPKKLVGQNCYEIVHGTKSPPESCPHECLLKDGKEHSIDTYEERLEGDFLITVSPIYDSDQKIVGSVHVAHDITELKRSERALQESEKKFRNLSDQSPNMIFINTKGRIVYVNQKCEEIIGYTKKEFYAPDFDFRKLITPESQKTIGEAFKKHMAGEDIEPYEYELITKDGRNLNAINAPKLITYEGEVSILGVVTDITDRVQMEKALRKSEEALRESEKTYRAIFENTGAVSVIIEEDMTISLVNEEFERIVGYSKKDVEWKKNWIEFILPKDLERLKTVHEQRRINPDVAPRHHEMRFINRQGKMIDVFVTVDMIPGTGKSVASAVDISDLKQAEKALKENEERYRMLAENSVDIIYVLDENLQRTYVSPSVERVLGYTPEEHKKQDREHYFSPGSMKVFQAAVKERWDRLKSGLDKDKPIKLEFEAIHKDGSQRWIETRAKPIYDDKDNFTGIIGVSRDITERKRLEQKLKEAHDELEQKVLLRTKELVMANEQLLKEIEERKRVEQNLKEAELCYRTVADFTYDWEYWIGSDGNLLYVSPSCERITGYRAENFIKDPNLLNKLIKKEEQELWAEKHTTRKRDEAHELQFRIRTKKGEERWIEHACQPVTDEKGKFLGYRASNRDITHRKKIEEELEIKDSAIASSISGIGITDMEGKLIYVNESLVKMWGYDKADEILGRNLTEFWEGDGIYETVEALRVKGGRIGEDIGKRKDRSLFPVQFAASVIKSKDGKPRYMFGSFIDISAQKVMEEDLTKKERSLAEAQRIAHLGNWDWNIVTNELYWSDEIYRIFGLTPQEFGATY